MMEAEKGEAGEFERNKSQGTSKSSAASNVMVAETAMVRTFYRNGVGLDLELCNTKKSDTCIPTLIFVVLFFFLFSRSRTDRWNP